MYGITRHLIFFVEYLLEDGRKRPKRVGGYQHVHISMHQLIIQLLLYEAYSESKYRLAVKKPSKVSYKILLLSDSTFFKLFFHIFY